jgi:hypothetical protein
MSKLSQVESELNASESIEHELPESVRRTKHKIAVGVEFLASEYDQLLREACEAIDRCLARHATEPTYTAQELAWFAAPIGGVS